MAALLHHAPGGESEVAGEGLFAPSDELLDADGLKLAGPLSWRLRVLNTGGDDDFIVDGEVEGSALLECRRCLTQVEVPVATKLVYPMLYRPSEQPLMLDEISDDGSEEQLVFGNPVVDFAQLLAQLYAIEVPLTALCRPDCLGLNEDGVNLNEHPELAVKRPEPEHASPFAAFEEALKDLDLKS